MYDEIRRIQVEERRSNNLSPLKEDTYSRAFAYLEELKRELAEKWDTQKARELDNCEKVLQEIERRRAEKILVAVFNETYNGLDAPHGLTAQEKLLYEKVRDVVVEFKKMIRNYNISADAKGVSPVDVKTVPKNSIDVINVRLLKEVPRFKATDGSEYGPFKVGDVCGLPKKEGEIMIKRNAAELVQK